MTVLIEDKHDIPKESRKDDHYHIADDVNEG